MTLHEFFVSPIASIRCWFHHYFSVLVRRTMNCDAVKCLAQSPFTYDSSMNVPCAMCCSQIHLMRYTYTTHTRPACIALIGYKSHEIETNEWTSIEKTFSQGHVAVSMNERDQWLAFGLLSTLDISLFSLVFVSLSSFVAAVRFICLYSIQ